MMAFNLMLVALLVVSVTLLSGVKIMFNIKYTQVIAIIVLLYILISQLIDGYTLGYMNLSWLIIISTIMLLIAIWSYRRSKYVYSIHNVKEKDVINIIEKYLEGKNIKYELRSEEIYFPDINKTMFVRSLMETTLDCKGIKNVDFYNKLVGEVRLGIKEIKQRYFPIEGVFYLILFLFLC